MARIVPPDVPEPSQWVLDQVLGLVNARHQQDMQEDQRTGHDANSFLCLDAGRCREVYRDLIKVVAV